MRGWDTISSASLHDQLERLELELNLLMLSPPEPRRVAPCARPSGLALRLPRYGVLTPESRHEVVRLEERAGASSWVRATHPESLDRLNVTFVPVDCEDLHEDGIVCESFRTYAE